MNTYTKQLITRAVKLAFLVAILVVAAPLWFGLVKKER